MTANLLAPLMDVIADVKARIGNHYDFLGKDETRTRISLVDPILRALGWDVGDPSVVTPNVQVGGRNVAYVLSGPRPSIVDSRVLGSDLRAIWTLDHIGRLPKDGIWNVGITDGNYWHQHYFRSKDADTQRRSISCCIRDGDTNHIAYSLIYFSRHNICADRTVSPPSDDFPQVAGFDDGASTNWIFLPDLEPRNRKPLALRLPDGSARGVQTWKQVAKETLAWLARSHPLDTLLSAKAKRGGYIVHLEGTNFRFTEPEYISLPSGDRLVFESHRPARVLVTRCIQLLDRCGLDPAAISVRLRR